MLRIMRREWRLPPWKSRMKLTSYSKAGFSPFRVFACVRSLTRASARARRRAWPGPGSDGWPFASLWVLCDARLAGPVAELAAFAALSTLRHLQRVSTRSALRARPASLCFSAAPIRPAQAAPAALPATGRVFDEARAAKASATGHPGRARRACEAPSSTGFGARARSALRELTRRACSTTVSAANEGSCATGPRTRAAQGSRSAAKTASHARRALPGCPVAAPLQASRKFDDSHRPQPSFCTAAFHASRVSQRAVEQLK